MRNSASIFLATSQFLFAFWPLMFLVILEPLIRGQRNSERVMRRAMYNLLILWSFLGVLRVSLFIGGREPEVYLLPEPLGSILFITTGLGVATIAGSRLLRARRRVLHRMWNAQTMADLMDLAPMEFESLVAEIYRSFGHRVEKVDSRGNSDVDLVIHTPNQEKWIVQCKRCREDVDETVVRDLLGRMHHSNAHRGTLITTTRFTSQALSWAEGKPIYLYDGEGLFKILNRARETKRANRIAPPVITEGKLLTRATAALLPSTSQVSGKKRKTLPICPNCGAQMVLRRGAPGEVGEENIYICQNSPECRVLLEMN